MAKKETQQENNTLNDRIEAEKQYLGKRAYVLFLMPNNHPMGEQKDTLFPMFLDSAGSNDEMVNRYFDKGAQIVGFNYEGIKDDERTLKIKQAVERLSRGIKPSAIKNDDSYLRERLEAEKKKQADANE